jgi:hypothetical protein
MLPDFIKKYSFNEIDSATESPGIYAWYAKLPAGLADWKSDFDETGKDLGESKLRNLLLFHSNKYNPPEYQLTAKSNFELQWLGQLTPQLTSSFDKYLRSDKEEDWDLKNNEKIKEIKNIQKPFKKEKNRALLVKVLENCCPFLSSPIYIGKSENLKRRLKEHASEIKKFSKALSAEPQKRANLLKYIQNERATFAARAIALGFIPEQLFVFTFDLGVFESKKCSQAELHELACTIEWLLNRWHRPVAGRI